MKLTTFTHNDRTHFGFAIDDRVVPFSAFDADTSALRSVDNYLDDLDAAFPAAQAIAARVANDPALLVEGKTAFAITDVTLELPLKPVMFYDMLTSPTHVYLSAKTMLKYEMNAVLRATVMPHLLRKQKKASEDLSQPEVPEYYKGNVASFTGTGSPLVWPHYTSFLDVEPELAFVTGNSTGSKVAGYLIINDCSARDIQMPEIGGTRLGPQRSKDFQNVMSPFIVTPDEKDPFDCKVDVRIGDRHHWTGRSDKYALPPHEAVAFMEKTARLQPGTLIALGTIPRCNCLDNDIWVQPGDKIRVEFEGIGIMENTVAAPEYLDRAQATRWGERADLKQYYKG